MIKIAPIITLLAACASALGAPPLQETVEKTYELPPNAEVNVRNTDGTIYLYGSEVDELKIFARKKAYSKERLDGISIDVSIEGDKAKINTIYPPRPQGLSLKDRSGTVDYTIIVPERCTLARIELENGEIIVNGLRVAKVNVGLTNGLIWAEDCFGPMQLKAAKGGIDVLYDWWETGTVALMAELAQGNVRVSLPPDPSVRLDAASVSGQITNQFGQEHGQTDGRTLQTTIGAKGGAEFKIRTTSGNIKIERGY
jgi:Putative adhesin